MKKMMPTLYVLGAATLWGCMGLFSRRMNTAGLFAVQTVELRALLGMFFTGLYLALRAPQKLRIKPRDLWCFFGTGICSLLFFSTCYFTGIAQAEMSVMSVLLYTAPVFVMLMSAALFSERITAKKLLALMMTVAGCALVSGIGTGQAIGTKTLVLGLCSGFGYALYSIFGRYAIKRGYDSWTITFYTFGFCAVGGAFLTDWQGLQTAFAADGNLWLWALAMGFFTAFAAYILYTKGLENMDSSRASILACLEPVVAAVVGLLVFAEIPTPVQVCGIALVLGGIVVLSAGKKA